MALTLALNDVLRLRVACYTATQQGINVIHYVVSSATGASQTDAFVAAAFDTTLAPRYKAAISAQARYRGVSLQRIKPIPTGFPQIVTANDGVGLVAGDQLPGQVSGIITSKTDFAGVAYRGRAYIPFPGEGSGDTDGTPTAAYVSLIDDIGDELFTQVIFGLAPNEVTLTPALWHRSTETTTKITAFEARDKWATQRRRGVYGKTNPVPF